jgi:hypothetical protein
MNKVSKQINALMVEATRIGLAEVERLARKALTTRGRAYSFTMGMGCATFYDKKGNAIDDIAERYVDGSWRNVCIGLQRCIQDALDFIAEHDNDLHLTGVSMRIKSPDSPTLTDW